ncbi:MAG: nitroreductase family protein [Myxococcota bacterium]|nr:nitroreductase family protein [Myxococcota bacterium]
MDAIEVLTTTVAVRRRIDFERPVPYETLQACVEIAVQAPLGGEEWQPHFLIVDDADQKERIGALYQAMNLPYIDQIEKRALDAADESNHARIRRTHDTFRWHGDNMGRMPALVIVGLRGRYESQPQLMQASAYGSVLPAAWSFMLAARTRGLGATWTTLHLGQADRVAEVLKLPSDFTQAVMLAVGFYKGDTFKPARRLPVSSYVHHNGW